MTRRGRRVTHKEKGKPGYRKEENSSKKNTGNYRRVHNYTIRQRRDSNIPTENYGKSKRSAKVNTKRQKIESDGEKR